MIQKLLMTTDTVGGVWTYSLELCSVLSSYGIEILLATMGNPLSDSQRRKAASIERVQLEESEFMLEWMNDPWEDIERAGRWLLKLERSFNPHIIHLNQFCFGQLPLRAPVLIVGHSCVSSWWSAVKDGPLPRKWDRYAQAVKAGLQGADCVVAPSKAMLNSLRKYYGPYRREAIIANGRNSELFRPGVKEEFIFAAGRVWDEGKNIRILADVAKRLPWPIFVAGDYRTAINSPNLRLLGKLEEEEIRAWFSRASIYISPALYEPFGLSVLEGALSECALVLSDIPSFLENWSGTAFFVNPTAGSSIREGVLTLIGNVSLRMILAQNARRRALRYTSKRMAQQYLRIYNNLLFLRHGPTSYTAPTQTRTPEA